MAHKSPKQAGEGLSLQTLVIAAVAAGTAAVVTSYFWEKGTLLSAAMTPVIVTIVSEMLKRPAQTMRRVARSARMSAPARGQIALPHGAGAGSPSEARSRQQPGSREVSGPGEPSALRESSTMREPRPLSGFSAPRESSAPMSQYKVYRAERRPRFGRIHWKIVLATAGIAFVIAVAALTLPELLFGSSVNGSQGTTLFGGKTQTSTSDKSKTTTDNQKTVTEQKTTTENQTTTQRTTTTPTATTPTQTSPSPSATPRQVAPPPSTTPAPQQQGPQQQQSPAPAPSG